MPGDGSLSMNSMSGLSLAGSTIGEDNVDAMSNSGKVAQQKADYGRQKKKY